MAFKALFIAHAPDADYEKHNSIIDTGKYKLLSFVVKSQDFSLESGTWSTLSSCRRRK